MIKQIVRTVRLPISFQAVETSRVEVYDVPKFHEDGEEMDQKSETAVTSRIMGETDFDPDFPIHERQREWLENAMWLSTPEDTIEITFSLKARKAMGRCLSELQERAKQVNTTKEVADGWECEPRSRSIVVPVSMCRTCDGDIREDIIRCNMSIQGSKTKEQVEDGVSVGRVSHEIDADESSRGDGAARGSDDQRKRRQRTAALTRATSAKAPVNPVLRALELPKPSSLSMITRSSKNGAPPSLSRSGLSSRVKVSAQMASVMMSARRRSDDASFDLLL